MKRIHCRVGVLLGIVIFGTRGFAQEASRPAPRTADGRVDFSGVWEPKFRLPCGAWGCQDTALSKEFVNLALVSTGPIPMLPAAAELLKERMATNGKDDPTSQCRPGGIIRMYTYPFFMKIVQTPKLMLVLSERELSYRQIFTDGRKMPEDTYPTPTGYSIGEWDGDSLVVRATGFQDGLWLDRAGHPLSDGAHITERFRRPDYNTLTIEETIDDSKNYSKPWTVTITEKLVPGGELQDYVCLENQQYEPGAK